MPLLYRSEASSKRRITIKSCTGYSVRLITLGMAISVSIRYNYNTAYTITIPPMNNNNGGASTVAGNETSFIDLGAFVVDPSHLHKMMSEPPTIISESKDSTIDHGNNFPIVDIVSIGSVSRLDYLTAQIETWASHRSTRHFWGFSEGQDYDLGCAASLSKDDGLKQFVTACEAILDTFQGQDYRIGAFFSKFYGATEGGRIRSGDAGWICAQRRPGRTFGWLHHQYSRGITSIPDYLMFADDDTYIDMVEVLKFMKDTEDEREGAAFGMNGCVFESSSGSNLPYHIPYGGFATVINKAALQQLSEPIYCNGRSTAHEVICSQIKRDSIGEASLFSDGMSIFQLFYLYTSLENFCFHSDWIIGYIFEFYVNALMTDLAREQDLEDSNLVSLERYPNCGNMTEDTGDIRLCTLDTKTCHNQDPQNMELFTLATFAKDRSAYNLPPKLSATDMEDALKIVEDIYDGVERTT